MRFISPLVAIILLSVALTSTTIAKQENLSSANSVEYLTSDETTSLNLPFSEAVRVGNILYLSGAIGNIPGKKKLVSGGIKAETKQVMENISRILQRNESSLDRVVKCTVMLADIKEWSAMNQVYVTYFSKKRLPARSAFGTSGLALGARVEIGCIATIDD
ncbi:MAG: RidA family protein [Mastigocoleus sp. MO_167.B18]|uniref:RidA family protein n=1 Tax=Mastigocoleus sp. MO_188.B34 TaxID=3036635 RepID=UPI002626C575|nr:RidA family protein [Mastigocoleus sp. MO_188.B34]MDJ0694452.1 RidA family protein [Mastigocoleus sp. MO_188.B34]MDJ0772321.1 RidA family protein [Mastigocoleus sp. MO_167.B18]